jgi:threonine dehydrogenase-like Zn-dependent dehydrogenase
MRACLLRDVGRIDVCEVPAPRPEPHDVLLRPAAVGLCGTDFHIFAGHGNYHTDNRGRPIPLQESPQILGHEIVGVVDQVGADVTDLRPGDRVLVDQGRNCLSARRTPLCEYCASGHSHQCVSYGEHGITGLQGGLAEYLAMPAVNAVRIESDVPNDRAVVAEPLGCIVHSCDAVLATASRYRLRGSDPASRVRSVLVTGAGPAGLLFVQYLRQALQYDGRLIVSEPNARKRELAAAFGADVIDPSATDLIEAVKDLTDGRRVECLIEASGAARVFTQIPGLLRKQGTLVLYSHGQSGLDLGVLNPIQFLEPALLSPCGASGGFDPDGRPATYRRSLRLVEDGRIQVGPWVTHRYQSLDEVPRAFGGAHHAPDYVKGVVVL